MSGKSALAIPVPPPPLKRSRLDDPRRPSLDDSPYRRTECLAITAMSLVYEAIDHRDGSRVIIKVSTPRHAGGEGDNSLFERERRILSELRIPGIPALLDQGEWLGLPYIVLPLVEGLTLHELARTTELDWPRAARIVAEVARIVAQVHREGFLHNDLSLTNVILDPASKPWVVDFGLARQVGAPTLACEREFVFGTTPFIAPERILFEASKWRPVSDVYSLGMLLYTLLAGSSPPDLQTTTEFHLLPGEPLGSHTVASEHVPIALWNLASRATKRDPEQRFSSALAFAEALDRALRFAPDRRVDTARIDLAAIATARAHPA